MKRQKLKNIINAKKNVEVEDLNKTYKEALEYILLGHHRDDIVENVFANVCRSRNILDLAVIQETSEIERVKICRPLIEHYKDAIISFAAKTDTPYFKDTTPEWSVRGKFRQKILPLLTDIFPGFKNNLLKINKESQEWSNFIEKNIINKYLNLINLDDNVIKIPIIIDDENFTTHPLCFWSEILTRILHKKGISSPSRKSLELFMKYIKTKSNKFKEKIRMGTSSHGYSSISSNFKT